MCNAYNHPPECNCGWGKGYGAGGYGSSGYYGTGSSIHQNPPSVITFKQPSLVDGFLWKRDRNPSFHSYLNPNARCPVCGASVYFYQSPYGGRVFFDELGPPWPKHPCTDNYFKDGNVERAIYESDTISYGETEWKKQGWKPLRDLIVINIDDEIDFFYAFTDEPITIHEFGLRIIYNLNFDSPLLCRRLINGSWEISWIPSAPSYLHLQPFTAIAYPFHLNFGRDHIRLWEKAAQGDVEAQNLVGMSMTFHMDNESERKNGTFPHKCDWAAAKLWFEAAAAKGYWASVNNLAVMYEHGYGVEQNSDMAFKLYSKAAEHMNSTTLNHLAYCYDRGIGTPIDMDMAHYLQELAALSENDDDDEEEEE